MPAFIRQPYAELHCKTNFSFLEGASHADELAPRAVALGLEALAITDRMSLCGVVRAHFAAKEAGLPLVVGAEIHPLDAPAVLLWAMDRTGYARLCRLLTRGRLRAPKGECELTLQDIAEHSDGLLAGVLLAHPSYHQSPADEKPIKKRAPATAGLEFAVPSGPFRQWGFRGRPLNAYRDIFGDRCYAVAELHFGADDAAMLDFMKSEARQARVPLVAANDVHFHVSERKILHDCLTAVRHNGSVLQHAGKLFPNAERRLKSPEEMIRLFASVPEAILRTTEIVERCRFSLDELRYEYPKEFCPPGLSASQYLAKLTSEGARKRYPTGVPAEVQAKINHELRLIEELGYEAYFLTVWDIVRFARSKGILCQGRGSAANSAVCYCLGVTEVNPHKFRLLFERFISKERGEAPDIDVDFEHERREEVLQYLYQKYGRDRAAMTAVTTTYQPKSAIRDIGKALGVSADRIDLFAKHVDPWGNEEAFEKRCREINIDPDLPVVRRWIALTRDLIGFPRHLSQHTGGMVLTQGPLCELAPLENAAMVDRTVLAWNKYDLDDLGILKVDCLGLGMLSAIRRCFAMIKKHWNRPLTLATVPAEDPEVYRMIQRADTIGVFQIESRAQMSMLPRLKPIEFYDLVIEVAIVRPGPIQGQMVHPYLRRREGKEAPVYPNKAVEKVLERTLGVPLFQEQAMELAVVAAGFTPGEADQLRRAMAAWRRPGLLETFRQKLMDGMKANGISDEFADRLFNQIKGFGEYGFPESHAASFALLVYVSAWLKCHYPAAFCAAIINSQPMGFYQPAQLVRDAREHGVEVRPIDINTSEWDCTLEPTNAGIALRLGFRLIFGLAETAAQEIVAARCDRPYTSVDDVALRTGLGKPALVLLSRADAFRSLELQRRGGLWQSLEDRTHSGALAHHTRDIETQPLLEPLTPPQEVFADYNTHGLTLRRHPMSFLREQLTKEGVRTCGSLLHTNNGTRVVVTGIILLRQRPATAKGITFVTIEDETGIANLVVRQETWEKYRRIARHAQVWQVKGAVERQGIVVHVLCFEIEDRSADLARLKVVSRDFR